MNINLVLAKALQFICFVLFTFMVLVYFGIIILIPLDILAIAIKLLSAIGLPLIIAAAFSIILVGFLALKLSKVPVLCSLLLEIGVELSRFAYSQLRRFDEIIEELQATSSVSDTASQTAN